MGKLIVIGGGLSGCEAAWQAAQRGLDVTLYEMRPLVLTGAHSSSQLAEVVCSNSFGSTLVDRASGLLKEEIRRLGSLLLQCAEETAVPAGSALAVDRDAFAALVTSKISSHPNIQVIRREITEIPDQPVIIASGPLTSPPLSAAILKLTGRDHLFFFDAVAPIVARDSIDMNFVFRASRYDRGEQEEGDYINCPFTKLEYQDFYQALINAQCVELKGFESEIQQGVLAGAHEYFEGCLPVEILARRDPDALTFGPMRPAGLSLHHTKGRPYAIVQLRQDNVAGTLYNMVGFQTNLRMSEQERVFRLIPGLKNAKFVHYGQMHRNTFIFSPALLLPTLQLRSRQEIFFSGQITGVEGYIGNIATGLLAGLNAARMLHGEPLLQLPVTTMLGALCQYITSASEKDFQPMKANFGLFPGSEEIKKLRSRAERAKAYSERALKALDEFMVSQILPAG